AAWLARKNRGWLILGYVILTVLTLWAIIPCYWMIVTSFKNESEMYDLTANILPKTFTLEHYRKMFFESAYPLYLRNSLIVGVTTTVIGVVIGSMAGYALTRLRFFGRLVIGRMLIYCYLAPGTVLFIPLFALFVSLKLTNSLYGLVLAYLTFTVPFCTWMLIGYFR